MTVTTVDKLLVAIGIGLWVTLILAVVVVYVAMRRNRDDAVPPVVAYRAGWSDGIIDALEQHGPGTDEPEARLLWTTAIEPTGPNPYLEVE